MHMHDSDCDDVVGANSCIDWFVCGFCIYLFIYIIFRIPLTKLSFTAPIGSLITLIGYLVYCCHYN